MKAQELMIGDWVLYKDVPHKIHTLTAAGEIRYETPNDLTELTYDDCNPIPLTAEILEKNGGDIEDACYANYKLPDDFAWLEFYFHELRLRKWWEGVDEWDNHNKVREITFQCHCKYVHELQHALRLCGLTELADNFII